MRKVAVANLPQPNYLPLPFVSTKNTRPVQMLEQTRAIAASACFGLVVFNLRVS